MDSDYSYSIHEKTILIIDLDKGGRSITNNMSNVLKDISFKEGIDLSFYNIAYKDSLNEWDGVKIGDNSKISFYPIRKPDEKSVLEFFKSQKIKK